MSCVFFFVFPQKLLDEVSGLESRHKDVKVLANNVVKYLGDGDASQATKDEVMASAKDSTEKYET